MAVVIESVASTAPTTAAGGTITITKPTGLADGDLMIAVIQSENGTITTPAGWTHYTAASPRTGLTNMYGKVADGTDAAASNFSWTESGSTYGGGTLYRISGALFSEIIEDGGSHLEAVNTAVIGVDVEPIANNSLIILHGVVTGSDTYTSNLSAFYITGGATPTFTNRTFLRDDGDNINMGLVDGFYASEDTITVIGFNDPNAESKYAGILLIPPLQDASGSNILATATATAFTQAGMTNASGSNTLATASSASFAQTGTATRPTQWANPAKPAVADFTNTPKP